MPYQIPILRTQVWNIQCMQKTKLQLLQTHVQKELCKVESWTQTETHQSTHRERHMLVQKCHLPSQMQMLSQTLRRENHTTNTLENEPTQMVFWKLHQEMGEGTTKDIQRRGQLCIRYVPVQRTRCEGRTAVQ